MNESPETRMSLLRRVRDSSDRAAWEEFVEIYEPLVYRVARRRGLQDADAREITQEAMLAVANAIDSWEPTAGQGSFRGWLFRIARNLCINLLTQQNRRSCGSGDSNMLQLLNEQPDPAPSENALYEEEYRRQLFRHAAEHVRPLFKAKTWDAFWRTCVDGEPIAKVATALEMPVGSVYAARSRVTAKIDRQIQNMKRD